MLVPRSLLVKLLAVTYLVVVTLIYFHYFHAYLTRGEWENIDIGLTRIILPDVYQYMVIIDPNDVITSILESRVKNTIGPSFLWVISGFSWINMILINALFVFLILHYLEKNLMLLQVSKNKIRLLMILIVALPSTPFYMLGVGKELVTMLLLLVILYASNISNYRLFLLSASLLVLFRYQFLPIIVVFFLIMKVKQRLGLLILLLFFAGSIYPLLHDFRLTSNEATTIFRSFQQATVGHVFEIVRNEYYVFSFFAVIVRVFQTVFEPALTFIGAPLNFFFENGYFSVYRFVQFTSMVLMLPFIIFYILSLRLLFKRDSANIQLHESANILFLMCTFFIGGFSFIHHRYWAPIFPILIMALFSNFQLRSNMKVK